MTATRPMRRVACICTTAWLLPCTLVVSAALPVKTVSELIAQAEVNPGTGVKLAP